MVSGHINFRGWEGGVRSVTKPLKANSRRLLEVPTRHILDSNRR